MQKEKSKTILSGITKFILSGFFSAEKLNNIIDDLEEKYDINVSEKGKIRTTFWYLIQILNLITGKIYNIIYWSLPMFKNYLKIAIRNLRKNKIHSVINVFGLSIGLACTLLILLFIRDELSYDKFHKNLDRIYFLTAFSHNPDGSISWKGGTAEGHGPALKEFLPEVKNCVRLRQTEFTLKKGDIIENQNVTYADKEFFEMFSFPLVRGNPSNVLSELNSVVISQSAAKKYFKDTEPVGKTIELVSGDYHNEFIVTGIAENPPSNSSISFEVIINFESLRLFGMGGHLHNFGLRANINTFIEFSKKPAADDFIKKYSQFLRNHYEGTFEITKKLSVKVNNDRYRWSFGFQPMKNFHFSKGLSNSSTPTAIYILIGIALIILFIAAVNFITLSIGNASKRFIEIGIRKVLGADKKHLIRQFWCESLLITAFAVLMGIGIIFFILPVFNKLTLKSINFINLLSASNLGSISIIIFSIGIIVGSYPAVVLAGFKPVEILKGKLKPGSKNFFSKSLIIVQFTLAIFLIVITIVLGRQINFMINTDLGFNKDNILVLDTYQGNSIESESLYNSLRDKLINQSNIKSIASASNSFSKTVNMDWFEYNDKRLYIIINRISHDYFKTLGIKILKGREFSREISSDQQVVILNETFIKEYEIENPVGKQIEIQEQFFTIIGVVKDHFTWSMKLEKRPVVHYLNPIGELRFTFIKILPNDISSSLNLIRSVWKELQPDKPFKYSFLDEDVEKQYLKEKKWNNIVKYSSLFAILISCMGVFGLSLITVQRRTKEIVIRKVHGATIYKILILLSKGPVIWVLIANIIAWPAAFYAMNKWLENFVYKISISPITFILAGIIMLFLVLTTTFYHTIKAARANPVESLRYE